VEKGLKRSTIHSSLPVTVELAVTGIVNWSDATKGVPPAVMRKLMRPAGEFEV
jgi:hypothetical protein